MPRTGRLGRTAFPPVTFVQTAWPAVPVPRFWPIHTLPSLVPTMAALWNFGEYLTWLMNERLPSDCLVMFCVAGLLVTTQVLAPPAPLIVSQTLVVPATRCPQPVAAPGGPQSSPPAIPPWNRSNGRMN